jgi:hypothetical protein
MRTNQAVAARTRAEIAASLVRSHGYSVKAAAAAMGVSMTCLQSVRYGRKEVRPHVDSSPRGCGPIPSAPAGFSADTVAWANDNLHDPEAQQILAMIGELPGFRADRAARGVA